MGKEKVTKKRQRLNSFLHLRLGDEQLRGLEAIAADRQLSVADVVREAIRERIGRGNVEVAR